MKLERGAFLRVLIRADWAATLASHEWVAEQSASHEAVEWVLEVHESLEDGLWAIVRSPPNCNIGEDQIWIPWIVVVAIVISPELRNVEQLVGFKSARPKPKAGF
jgi:hypothetical protein